MRLNLGCGHDPLPDWRNVDSHAEEADVVGDIRELHFHGITEVRMSHVLEHISWRETNDVLKRIHGWMRPLSHLSIEVPDMEQIIKEAPMNPDWLRYFYGSQEHEGEYHRTGFTAISLASAIHKSGFTFAEVIRFRSTNPHRDNMPCLLATAFA